MALLSKNLCYLLWKANISRDRWSVTLASWAGCGEKRAYELLQGKNIDDNELTQLSERLNRDPSEICFQDLLEQDLTVNILKENIDRLVNNLPFGSKKDLAGEIGVQDFTLSRWIAGKQRPPARKLKKLQERFNIPSTIELDKDPLFLRFEPLNSSEKREWLHRQIDKLDNDVLNEIFPALEKLLV